jgi:endonuclease/exonuclease/phosphatase family metal-dependent hydrolase
MLRTCLVLLSLTFLMACATPSTVTIPPTATHTVESPSPTATWTPTGTPTFTPTFTPTVLPTPSLTPMPAASVKVLSYNILYGAGFDRQWDAGVPPNLVGKNRLPDLITAVKAINPDIWGIQEATGWDRGTPTVIQQVAQKLGMNYFLAQVPSGFHLGLITKFVILETENLSAEVGRQGVLRATLLSPAGKKITVFVVHLDPATADTRVCEINSLIQQMQPYTGQWTILMGDMNFQPSSREYQRLEQAGWQPMAVEPSWGIDQIWVYSSVRWTSTTWFQLLPTPKDLSDHNPIGAELYTYSMAATTPTHTPFAPAPTPPIPSFVSNTLTGVRVLRLARFDDACASSQWTSRWKTEQFLNGALEIIGEAPWQASTSRYKEFFAGQGILLRFQYTPGSEFEFHFDNPTWNIEPYRRFGINIFNSRARATIWQNSNGPRSERLSDDPDFAPNVWYTLLLALGKDGELGAQIWDPADLRRVVNYHGWLDDKSSAPPWIFQISANKGKVTIDSLTELSFSGIK